MHRRHLPRPVPPHLSRAEARGPQAPSHLASAPRAVALALFGLLAGLSGACDTNAEGPGASQSSGAPMGSAQAGDNQTPGTPAAALDPRAVSDLEALRRTFAPISPTATSDKRREWRDAKQRHVEELQRGTPELGRAAAVWFDQEREASDEWRTALLSIVAHTDRERARPLLERLCTVYDGTASRGVRAEAVRLLALTSPAAAVELFEPLVLDPRPATTYPPKEQMLREWTRAARALRKPVDSVLAQVATDIQQTPDTRYVAVEELGRERDAKLGRRALETVLVESGSDGLLRRKAAQALRDSLSREELCEVLERVGERESDQAFALFLADMLAKNCP